MHTLTVYISDDCWSCEETHRILAALKPRFPDLVIELVDTQLEPMPDGVFAVPTYLLDGEIISLGNPTMAALEKKLVPLFLEQATRLKLAQNDQTA